MKVSFKNEVTIQKPISLTQEEMKTYKSKKVPVYRTFLFFILFLSMLFGAYKLYYRNTLYTYGIVSGKEVEATSAGFDEIKSVLVKKGDKVKKGQVLFTKLSSKGQVEITAIQSKLQKKLKEYEVLELNSHTAKGQPDNKETIENDIKLLQLKQRGLAIERERKLAIAHSKRNRLKTLYVAKNERYNNFLKLFKLDAATRSQVKSSKTERAIINNEYSLSRDQYHRLIREGALAISKEKIELAKLKSTQQEASVQLEIDINALFSEIKSLKAHLINLQKKYGSVAYLAPFDAIITSVKVSIDTTVTADEPILTMTSLSDLWVDVYVEARKTHLLTDEKEILIYPEGSNSSIPGLLVSKGAVQLRIPPHLKEKIPNETSAVYFHVQFDKNEDMLFGNIVKVVVK